MINTAGPSPFRSTVRSRPACVNGKSVESGRRSIVDVNAPNGFGEPERLDVPSKPGFYGLQPAQLGWLVKTVCAAASSNLFLANVG